MNFNDEKKRCVLPSTFSELNEIIRRSFGIDAKEPLTVSYVDDEEDLVQISNQYDFDQAVAFLENKGLEVLRVQIEKPEAGLNGQEAINEDFELINKTSLYEKPKEKEEAEEERLEKIEIVDTGNKVKDELAKIIMDLEKYKTYKPIQEIVTVSEPTKKKPSSKKSPAQKKPKQIKVSDLEQASVPSKPKAMAPKKLTAYKKLSRKETAKKVAAKEIKRAITQEMKKICVEVVKKTVEQSDSMIEKHFAEEEVKEALKKSQRIPKSNIAHSTVRCDGCRAFPIVGNRFKCSICRDFDFCEACEDKFAGAHGHPFIKIRKPELCPSEIITMVKDDKKYEEMVNMKVIGDKVNYYYNKAVDSFKNINFQKITGELFQAFRAQNEEEVPMVDSKFVTENLNVHPVNNHGQFRKNVRIVNTGKVAWSKPCYLACIQSLSGVQGRAVVIRRSIAPGEQIQVSVDLNLYNVPQGEYKSVWQMTNSCGQFFGERLELTVTNEHSSNLQVDLSTVNKPVQDVQGTVSTADFLNQLKKSQAKETTEVKAPVRIDFMALAKQTKEQHGLKDIEIATLLNALIMTNGNVEAALMNLKSNRFNIGGHYNKLKFN